MALRGGEDGAPLVISAAGGSRWKSTLRPMNSETSASSCANT